MAGLISSLRVAALACGALFACSSEQFSARDDDSGGAGASAGQGAAGHGGSGARPNSAGAGGTAQAGSPNAARGGAGGAGSVGGSGATAAVGGVFFDVGGAAPGLGGAAGSSLGGTSDGGTSASSSGGSAGLAGVGGVDIAGANAGGSSAGGATGAGSGGENTAGSSAGTAAGGTGGSAGQGGQGGSAGSGGEVVGGCGEQLLWNGNFDAGPTSEWSESSDWSAGLDIIVGRTNAALVAEMVQPYSGDYLAWLGGIPDNDFDHHVVILRQQVAIPEETGLLTLSGRIWVKTLEDNTFEADEVYLEFERNDAVVWQAKHFTNLDAENEGWQQFSASTSSPEQLRGRTVGFVAYSRTDPTLKTSFWLDSLRLEATCDR